MNERLEHERNVRRKLARRGRPRNAPGRRIAIEVARREVRRNDTYLRLYSSLIALAAEARASGLSGGLQLTVTGISTGQETPTSAAAMHRRFEAESRQRALVEGANPQFHVLADVHQRAAELLEAGAVVLDKLSKSPGAGASR